MKVTLQVEKDGHTSHCTVKVRQLPLLLLLLPGLSHYMYYMADSLSPSGLYYCIFQAIP